jgi:hypothetical protein
MKNNRITISLIFLGAVMVSMMVMAVLTKAADSSSLNPYDNPDLNMDDIVTLYHTNMNDAFNNYIKMMMKNLEKNPDDPNGKPYKEDGTPFTVEDCLDPANSKNYSTFCVAVNLVGGNTDNCNIPTPPPTIVLPSDMQKLCSLDKNALALKGYLNFSAAMKKRTTQIFKTSQEKSAYVDAMTCLGGVCDQETKDKAQVTYQTQKALEVSADLNFANQEIKFAKNTLDQTLSAYDQLRVAWPIHKKYIEIYADLEKYRDKIVEIRHQTDLYPKKFIDLTTTACI